MNPLKVSLVPHQCSDLAPPLIGTTPVCVLAPPLSVKNVRTIQPSTGRT